MAPPLVFVIGGTGAQGLPIVEALVKDSRYAVRVLTRDKSSLRSRQLAALSPTVSLIEGSFASEDNLRLGYAGADYAFVNIDGSSLASSKTQPLFSHVSYLATTGFNTGESKEIYWGIRSYELAIEAGIKFFIWGNLDYALKLSQYDSKFRTGHYDGKGRVGEWILQQNQANLERMQSALFTTGPYIDMVISSRTVMTPRIERDAAEEEVVTWRMPLGDGAVPHVALSDCGHYVRWMLDHQQQASGLDLQVAIAHIGYHELAEAFTKVTGRKARYIDIGLEQYWKDGPMAMGKSQAAGYNSNMGDPGTMSIETNFTGFWAMWRASADNRGMIKRDYALLDRILPGRVKSAEEWFRQEDERGRKAGEGTLWERTVLAATGKGKPILKVGEDRRKGKL